MKSKRNFLCVLQTHTLSNNQDKYGFTRYCGAPKSEVTKRCVRSLVESINYASFHLPDIDFKLCVLDDHSDDDAIAMLNLMMVEYPCMAINLFIF